LSDESKFTTVDDRGRLASPSTPNHPPSADDVLKLAGELLERGRSDEALATIEQYAAANPDARPASAEQPPVFDTGVSDRELDLAFDSAESDRDQMLDADEIAQQAIRQTEPEIRDLSEIPAAEADFADSGASYATRTVAQLLERQGDSPTASRVRAIADSSEQHTADSNPPVRDRRTSTIKELERWLVNIRAAAQ
jgi:hypothetical protein